MNAAGVEARLQHIPTNLITGHLGAGKTTAILGLLARKPEGARWAVLINDFNQGGDGPKDLLGVGAKNVTVSKVEGGCICCTAQVSLRVELMRLLRKARPDRLLIEASALARPAAVLATLRDPWLADVLSPRATICIVDPRQFADRQLAAGEIYLDQFALAEVIIANKADLATQAQLEGLLDHARGLMPKKLRALAAVNGEFALDLLDLVAATTEKAAALTSAA